MLSAEREPVRNRVSEYTIYTEWALMPAIPTDEHLSYGIADKSAVPSAGSSPYELSPVWVTVWEDSDFSV